MPTFKNRKLFGHFIKYRRMSKKKNVKEAHKTCLLLILTPTLIVLSSIFGEMSLQDYYSLIAIYIIEL